MLNLPYDSLHSAAKAFELRLPDLHLRSYGRDPFTSTMLWLCKERRKGKAYSQGKYIFAKPAERFAYAEGTIYCGLYVERGVKQSFNKEELLQPRWQWNQFVKDMDAKVGAAVARACAIVGEPLDVVLLATLKENRDRLTLKSTGHSLSPHASEMNANVLMDACSVQNWPELMQQLTRLPPSTDWHWIDVHIGSPCSVDPNGPDNTESCLKMLQCFNNWLGTS